MPTTALHASQRLQHKLPTDEMQETVVQHNNDLITQVFSGNSFAPLAIPTSDYDTDSEDVLHVQSSAGWGGSFTSRYEVEGDLPWILAGPRMLPLVPSLPPRGPHSCYNRQHLHCFYPPTHFTLPTTSHMISRIYYTVSLVNKMLETRLMRYCFHQGSSARSCCW